MQQKQERWCQGLTQISLLCFSPGRSFWSPVYSIVRVTSSDLFCCCILSVWWITLACVSIIQFMYLFKWNSSFHYKTQGFWFDVSNHVLLTKPSHKSRLKLNLKHGTASDERSPELVFERGTPSVGLTEAQLNRDAKWVHEPMCVPCVWRTQAWASR